VDRLGVEHVVVAIAIPVAVAQVVVIEVMTEAEGLVGLGNQEVQVVVTSVLKLESLQEHVGWANRWPDSVDSKAGGFMEFDGNFPVAERHDQVVKAARLEDKNWGDALAVLLDGVGLHHVDAAQLVVPNESANEVVSERKGQGHFASQ
jgi:hypothetical protein